METDPALACFSVAVAAGEDFDLARAALALELFATPGLDIESFVAQLDLIAAASRRSDDDPVRTIAGLFGPDRFRGNDETYYDPRNSFLSQVLERRLGIPISLAVVAIEVGRRLGIAVTGVPFPGHFLVRVAGREGPVLLDVFAGGRPLDDADVLRLLAATTGRIHGLGPRELGGTGHRQILTRMLHNLKAIYFRADDIECALAIEDRLLVLQPDEAIERRDRGLLLARLGRDELAADDLNLYLSLKPGSDDAEAIATILNQLARRSGSLH